MSIVNWQLLESFKKGTKQDQCAGMALKPRAPHPEEKYVSVLTNSQLAGTFSLVRARLVLMSLYTAVYAASLLLFAH